MRGRPCRVCDGRGRQILGVGAEQGRSGWLNRGTWLGCCSCHLLQDAYGSLTDQPLDLEDFDPYTCTQKDFEVAWMGAAQNPPPRPTARVRWRRRR